jgi:alkanesulfonate monooxygenase SsuD/methylene tetrahydromethanopterin reductase-like flavin-dependent oxidoreductase (luciferase family)
MRLGLTFSYANYTDWDRFEALERGETVGSMAIEDRDIWLDTLALADLAEPLGFDTLWTIEQHAAPYLMVPDPTQYLSYVAGRTKHIDVGSMITVLPWHNPVRLAEQIAMLQYFLGPDRSYHLGVGRGLARRNFEAVGVPMDESRERFNEVLDILTLAFTQEKFSYEGEHHRLENVSIRPRPLDPSTVVEAWAAWTSETSLRNFAQRGLHPLTSPNKTMESYHRELELFDEVRVEHGHGPARRPIFSSPMFCSESAQEAEEGAHRYFGEYVDSILRQYEMGTSRYANAKGYEEYTTQGSDFGDGTLGDAQATLQSKIVEHDSIWGTPDECVEKILALHQEVEPSELILMATAGSMSIAQGEASLRLFADRVLPRIAHLRSDTPARARAGGR